MKFSLPTTFFALALVFAPQAAAQKTRVQTKTVTRTETQRELRDAQREQRDAQREARESQRDLRDTEHKDKGEDAQAERNTAADPQAVVSLCLSEGDIVVRGWDRAEVRARAEGAEQVRLLTSPNAQPAARVEVLVAEDKEEEPDSGDCGTAEQIELSVPRGATVNVRTQSGHVDLSDVADARIEALSGDVDVRRVTKALAVSCLSGDVSLTDASGPVRLITVSGSVEARNVRSLAAGDEFEAKSTSGDVTIENVKHAQVTSATVSGNLLYTGGLARGGAYDFKTISGDVTMEIPADSSFNLHAKVVISGDIDTDFPVKTVAVGTGGPPPPGGGPHGEPGSSQTPPPGQPSGPRAQPAPPAQPAAEHWPMPPQPQRVKPGKVKPPKEPEQVRLDGTVGTGDATISMSSFSGSLHLRKQ